MKGNYDHVASFYDGLSRFIYGNAIVNAQRFFVDSIVANSTILIIGGGTGWILEEISKKHSGGLQITYVDISKKMIELSMNRKCGSNNVLFINESIQDARLNHIFDTVITPFLLDNFSTGTVNSVFSKIHNLLTLNGLWLFADFQVSENYKWWQKPLLKIMYFFFKLLCNVEANRLPDTNTLFKKYGYKAIASKAFFHHFICGVIFQKQEAAL